MNLNKKTFEALVMGGAFDCFEGIHRAQYFNQNGNESNIEKIIKYGKRKQEEATAKKAQEERQRAEEERKRKEEAERKQREEAERKRKAEADAKARQKAIIMREKTASSRLQVKKKIDSDRVDDALSRFDRYERKIDDIEAQVESYDMGSKSLADEIAELASDEKIDDELAELKAKMKSDTKTK